MNWHLFCDCFILFLVAVCGVLYYLTTLRSFVGMKFTSNARKLLRTVFVIAAGTFVFFGSEYQRNWGDIRIFFDSIYRSARLLLLDGTLEFKNVCDNFSCKPMAYIYIAAYYVVCGVAAITAVYTVFSLFKNVVERRKLFAKLKKKDVCVFNELNERSLATARSLMEHPWPEREKDGSFEGNSKDEKVYDFFSVRPEGTPVIAFCDVYRQNNEISHELIAEAEKLNAICLKMSIVDLHRRLRDKKAYKHSKKHIFRYYLFGFNENENMHHTVEIVDIEKQAHDENKPLFFNLGIFVIALDHAKGVMIDSLNYKLAQLYTAVEQEDVEQEPKAAENQDKAETNETTATITGGEKTDVADGTEQNKGDKEQKKEEKGDTEADRIGASGVFIRRLNPALMMAQHIVFDPYHCLVEKGKNADKDLNVIVLGAGSYGIELIKCLCWFYQRITGGITIHVVDKSPDAEDMLKAKMAQLIGHKNPEDPTQDAKLNVKVYGGVDVLRHSFKDKLKDALVDPDAVFVCLGDDNLNVEVAMAVRTLLDRINYKQVYDAYDNSDGNEYVKITKHGDDIELEDKIKIFAVVHKKENDLSHDMGGWNRFSSGNFNIRCVGMDTNVYSEKEIYDFDFERAALKRHRGHNGDKTLVYAINSYISCEVDRISSKSSEAHKSLVLGLYDSVEQDENNKKPVYHKNGALTENYYGSDEQAMTESKRWNAYMLCRGAVVVDEKMDKDRHQAIYYNKKKSVEWRFDRGMWHNGISPFNEKTQKEKENNRYEK
ncbi:MAG: hypothetical protein J6S13_07450 [Clostridia bacterium]|nr:hypothetical protein [Clostridia bacterium]